MARTEILRAVICDAGPIIHLDELAHLSLLSDFAEVLIPDQRNMTPALPPLSRPFLWGPGNEKR